jgi:hypothetical protein
MNDQEFAAAVQKEIARARSLFPGNEATAAALGEEVGEVFKALMYEPWDALVKGMRPSCRNGAATRDRRR